MTSRIWKFPVPLAAEFELSLPEAARVLHVGLDADGQPSLWAFMDPDEPRLQRRFCLLGTGIPSDIDASCYRGTFIRAPLVLHLFEQGP